MALEAFQNGWMICGGGQRPEEPKGVGYLEPTTRVRLSSWTIHAFSERQLRDEVKSGGNQPTDISVIHRRYASRSCPEPSTLMRKT